MNKPTEEKKEILVKSGWMNITDQKLMEYDEIEGMFSEYEEHMKTGIKLIN